MIVTISSRLVFNVMDGRNQFMLCIQREPILEVDQVLKRMHPEWLNTFEYNSSKRMIFMDV